MSNTATATKAVTTKTTTKTATKTALAQAIEKAAKANPTNAEQLDATTIPDIFGPEPETTKGEPTMDNSIVPMKTPDVLQTLREAAENAALALSRALTTDSVSAISKAREDANTTAAKYNAALTDRLYDSFLATDNPMLSMVETGFYKRLMVQVVNEKAGQTARTNERDAVFNVSLFVRYADTRNIVNNSLWRPLLEKMACLLAIRATDDIGGDSAAMLENYAMSEQARGMIHKDVKPRQQNPISNNTLLSGLQEVFDALLFVPVEGKDHNKYRLTSHDLHYILYTCFHKGRDKATLSMPTFDTLAMRFVEVMHVRVKGLRYGAEYKTIERKELAA